MSSVKSLVHSIQNLKCLRHVSKLWCVYIVTGNILIKSRFKMFNVLCVWFKWLMSVLFTRVKTLKLRLNFQFSKKHNVVFYFLALSYFDNYYKYFSSILCSLYNIKHFKKCIFKYIYLLHFLDRYLKQNHDGKNYIIQLLYILLSLCAHFIINVICLFLLCNERTVIWTKRLANYTRLKYLYGKSFTCNITIRVF